MVFSAIRTPYYRVGSRFVCCASLLRRVLLLCGSDIGGLVLRCPISAIGRLSSFVRRFSLCIRSILADRKTPPRPYDAKCGCSAMLVWRSLAADTIRSMSVTLHCMRHVEPSAYMPSTFLVVTRCVATFVSYRAIVSPALSLFIAFG